MNFIRPATQEEVTKLAQNSDLGFTEHYVWALDDEKHGTHFFVFKRIWELDPVWFAPGTPKNMKSMILWMLENCLRMQGVPSFYFNIENKNKDFMDSMVHHGAERVSPDPSTVCAHCGNIASDIRFKKVLVPKQQIQPPTPAAPAEEKA